MFMSCCKRRNGECGVVGLTVSFFFFFFFFFLIGFDMTCGGV